MKKTFYIRLIFFFLLLLAADLNYSKVHAVVADETESRQFDEESWDELTDDLDYWKDEKDEKEEKERKERKSRSLGEIDLGPLKYVLLAVLIMTLVAVLIRVFASELFNAPKKLEDDSMLLIGDLEGDLANAPLETALRGCIEKGHFKAAVRIYYLMALKRMDHRKFIKWHRDKTNSKYLSEMRDRKAFESFRMATRSFELIWYGPSEQLSEAEFRRVEPLFTQLMKELDQ